MFGNNCLLFFDKIFTLSFGRFLFESILLNKVVDVVVEKMSRDGESVTRVLPQRKKCRSESIIVPGSAVCTDYVKIDVSGQVFHLERSKLAKFPSTLLGNKEQRQHFWLASEKAYVFDRRAHYFQPIFDFYQSGNPIQRTEHHELQSFVNELIFFQMDTYLLKGNKEKEDQLKKWQLNLSNFLKFPQHNRAAHYFNLMSVICTITSVAQFCLVTVPQFQTERFKWPSFCVETVVNSFFILEIVLRRLIAFSWRHFLGDVNIRIDILSVLPFIIDLMLLTMTIRKATPQTKSDNSQSFL